ncbi:MAG: DUF2723 domain-containing protein [candidate division Zixibacteria bacterium]|nr:DUF2723 domain-containing protein [candidate division Zixibacteria bacterium]
MDHQTFHRAQYVLGGLITVATMVVYGMTVAPVLSYWDCGEFIACSKILGIPHPPGTPLYILIGRVFTLIPFGEDVSLRVNMVSSITSALAAGMAFFVIVRLLQGAFRTDHDDLELWQAVVALCGGIAGSLFMAFSSTYWNNAVEAEVYGPSILLIMVLAWLALRWRDRLRSGYENKYLVAIAYLGILSMGIHQTVLLALPVVFFFIILVDESLRRDWRFWITGIVLFSVVGSVKFFLVGSALWLVITLLMSVNRKWVGRWALMAVIMIASWTGYTCQLYIPIRSAEDPNIDENNPETLGSFMDFLERKQYGQQSMVTRMFTRRGTWANQFGDHAHMGFYRYFKDQYGFGGWLMLPVIMLGFYGVWWLMRRRLPSGSLIFLLFLMGSVVIVLYMNFADGTQYYKLAPDAYMEVRHRDYFFTPGFVVFGMMMGLGLVALADAAARKLPMGKTLAMVIGVIAALLPLRTLQANWLSCDRSDNYTPYDYAYNILNSCEENAILFTGGDNDTFPLWCLQDAYGIRTDVSICNLSLANTDWYIHQLKNRWDLPVTWDDDQILWTVSDPQAAGALKRPKRPIQDPVSGTSHYLFTTRIGDQTVTPAMMVVEHILLNNNWKRPVYFSGSPSGKSRLSLERRTKIVGAVFQVGRQEAYFEFDWDRTAYLMDTVFQFRSYHTPDVGLDDNAVGLALVYPEKQLAIADHYLETGDTTLSEYWIKEAMATFPFYWRSYDKLATHYRQIGDSARADEALQTGLDTIATYAHKMPENRLYWFYWGRLCESAGLDDQAQEYLTRAYYNNPYDQQTYQGLIAFLIARDKRQEAARAARKWLEYYPDDNRAQTIVSMASQPRGQ